MSNIKYEPVFGDQNLFDGMMDDCEFIVGDYGFKESCLILYYCERHNQKYGWQYSEKTLGKLTPVIAMRRIVKTTVWTKADKDDGRLPEIGCLVQYIDTKRKGVIRAVNGDEVCMETDQGIYISYIHDIEPIETPEERAERLRSEWCSECTSKYYPRGHKGFPEMIYDALLSGELPLPKGMTK